MDLPVRILVFLVGLAVVLGTLSSAISTFVVPRSVRSRLNRILFVLLRRIFHVVMRFARTF